MPGPRHRRRAIVSGIALLAAAALASGCGGADEPDLVNGKAKFIGEGKCGSCHTLARAGTQATIGPSLDEAFGPSREQGLGKGTIQGVVRDQIANVRRGSEMPEDLVTGDDARDVAAYVAQVAGMPGEDMGALATAGLEDATDGEQIFTAAGCGSCHAFAPAGTTGDIGPSLDELADVAAEREGGLEPEEYVEESIVEPDAFVADGYEAGVMPSTYADQLTPEQIDLLNEYLLGGESASG